MARALLTTRFAGQSSSLAVWYEAENTDASPLEGLGVRYVSDITNTDLVMIAGVSSEGASLSMYRDGFQHAIQRGVPCICTNPDHQRLTPKVIRFAAGQIAQLYQDMGGQVEWIGKPFGAMYAQAINLVHEGAKIICLGDSIAHDIKGARDAGLKSALVLTGLTNEEDLTTLCP